MTPHQTLAVALRLFAIWIGIQALAWVPGVFSLGTKAPQSPYVYGTFFLAVNGVIILVLWFFPRTIAGQLLPSHDTQSQPSATAETWLATGCTLIGLWTLSTTIPKLAVDLFLLKSIQEQGRLAEWSLYTVAEVVIGIWLVLGAKGVGKIFRWAQYAGTRKGL
jgi:hypothetical protein